MRYAVEDGLRFLPCSELDDAVKYAFNQLSPLGNMIVISPTKRVPLKLPFITPVLVKRILRELGEIHLSAGESLAARLIKITETERYTSGQTSPSTTCFRIYADKPERT